MRHARPASGWGEDADPALDDTGRKQAEAAARTLSQRLKPAPILTSPLRRCRETAEPLARLWGLSPRVLPVFGEVPAPGRTPAERRRWLEQAMAGRWSDVQGFDHASWRRGILDALSGFSEETVVYTHYIAINVVVAAARGVDEVVCFRPDHASITTAQSTSGALEILELGRQADTSVLARG